MFVTKYIKTGAKMYKSQAMRSGVAVAGILLGGVCATQAVAHPAGKSYLYIHNDSMDDITVVCTEHEGITRVTKDAHARLGYDHQGVMSCTATAVNGSWAMRANVPCTRGTTTEWEIVGPVVRANKPKDYEGEQDTSAR